MYPYSRFECTHILSERVPIFLVEGSFQNLLIRMYPYSGKNVPIFLECAHIGRMYPYSRFGCTHILTHSTHILECTNILVRMSHILRMCPYSRNRRIEYAHILECAHILGIAEYNDIYSVNA